MASREVSPQLTMPGRPQPSCMDDFDPASLPLDEALARIDALVPRLADTERVALRTSLGRILGEDVHSPVDVPAHTNSAMDGYAVRASDIPPEGDGQLKIVGTSWAGRAFGGRIGPGECARIMTGGVMPEGSDTVVMQEDCRLAADIVHVHGLHRRGQHVRAAGEDLARDQVALHRGRRVTPADLGLLASLGIGEVSVVRRPRVAFFSTGDELRTIGEPLAPGEVYDSNRYTLYGMLERIGAEVIDLGVVRDDLVATQDALRSAARMADVVVASAGASVGEADFIKAALEEVGEVDFWKIAMKPGRPLSLGKIGNAVFFGLPGNPVSVMVTFYQCVAPALRRLMGESRSRALRLPVRCVSTLKKQPGRLEFQRGVLERDEQGALSVRSTGGQGSGILSSMSQANCFIVLPVESGDVPADTIVEVEPFEDII